MRKSESQCWPCLVSLLTAGTTSVLAFAVAVAFLMNTGRMTDEIGGGQQLQAIEQRLRNIEDRQAVTVLAASPYRGIGTNPYRGIGSGIGKQNQLQPGWLAQVFPPPRGGAQLPTGPDLGTFILDETKFHLQIHDGHAIAQPNAAAYRLKAFYVAEKSGRREFSFDLKYLCAGAMKTGAPANCTVRLKIDNRTLIDQRTRLLPPNFNEALLAGRIHLEPGIYVAEAEIACDIGAKSKGRDMFVLIRTRPPGAASFSQRRDAFLHKVS